MIPLKERMGMIKRKANPLSYIQQDTEIMIKQIQEITLPELTEEEKTEYKKLLGKKKYKETEKIEEEFTQIIEAINIINAKHTDKKLETINHYITHFKEIIIMMEREKESKYTYQTLNIIKPLIKPEMTRFIAKYEDIIKKEEETTGYTPLQLTNPEETTEEE